MAKKRKQPKKDHTVVGVVAACLMVAVTVFLGWRAVNFINPSVADKVETAAGTGAGRAFLVYRSYKVLDRGTEAWPNDDTVSYEFFRHPLDGSAAVSESLAKEVVEGSDQLTGVPWMSKVSPGVLMFARRVGGPDDVLWIDVSGKEVRHLSESRDIIWSGLPSPDNRKVAYRDSGSGSIIIVDGDGNRSEYPIPLADGAMPVPFAWDASGETLFARTESVTEGEDVGFADGLWRLHVPSRSAEEVKAVRELGLHQIDIDPATGNLIGVTYDCGSLESCGTAPSSLYLVDTLSGESIEIMSSESYVYGRPKFSPDGTRIAFTITNGASDVWIADADVSGHERRVVSGSLLDWTPDGNTLVVDRDNELQLVSVSDGTARTVARRSGKYPDPDFHGVDYVGIIIKR